MINDVTKRTDDIMWDITIQINYYMLIPRPYMSASVDIGIGN